MHATTLLLTSLAALTSATPVPSTNNYSPNNLFHIENFVFGCTTTCDWYYDITVTNSSENHPSTGPVHCQGSLDTIKSFADAENVCAVPSANQHIATFIDKETNLLQIQYRYTPGDSYEFWYEGNQTVNAATSGKPQATDFYIPESKAYAVG